MQILGAMGLYICGVLLHAALLQGAYLWHAIHFIVLIPAQLRKCRAIDRETALR